MRILVINWQDIKNPFAGGAEVHLWQVFKRLVARGHEVTALVSRFSGAPDEEETEGIRVLRRGSRNLFNWQVPSLYKSELRGKYDIVVEDFNKLPFYCRYYVKEPLVLCTLHFFGKEIFYELGPLKGAYVWLQERAALRLYRSVPCVALSKSTRAEMLSTGYRQENIRVVTPGVEHEHFFPGERAETPTVVYLGRMKRYKRPDLALSIVARAREKVPGLHLDMVGGGEYLNRTKSVAAGLGLQDCTTFHGHVGIQEKTRLLQRAWVALNTSPREGWGLVNTEAEACGTPVVAFDTPGVRESLADGKSGFLHPFGSTDAAARSLAAILTDKALRGRLSRGAVRFASTLSWERTADGWESALQDVLSAGRP